MTPCKRGHTVGRRANGVCKGCAKERARAHAKEQQRGRGQIARVNLPLAPLRELLRLRALEYADEIGGLNNGHKALARRIAPRLGQTAGTAERTLQRLLKPATLFVSWPVADAWCCAVGVPIASIYTDAELQGDWSTADYKPDKPPSPKCKCGRTILARGWDKCHVCRNEDMNFRCKHCGRGLMSEHGLFLHSMQVHNDKTQGRHSWAGKGKGVAV